MAGRMVAITGNYEYWKYQWRYCYGQLYNAFLLPLVSFNRSEKSAQLHSTRNHQLFSQSTAGHTSIRKETAFFFFLFFYI